MRSPWLGKVLDSVADRGRELLNKRGAAKGAGSMEGLCRALLSEKGEASGTALAREVVDRYRQMTGPERLAFYESLYEQFGPDSSAIADAAGAYRDEPGDAQYLALRKAVEPARQKLFRRINTAPGGTQTLVDLRADLIKACREYPHLKSVDADLKRLFIAWFNRGFLKLERIDWHTSATILEKLISYESVHEIRSWADLRRRLASDRRCFAFFHPALPEEPLIFIQVALVQDMSSSIEPLLDQDRPPMDIHEADAAIFYSINNCLFGLRGISFGNFLIKQVATELAREIPGLKLYSTLSPMPVFVRALADKDLFTDQRLQMILGPTAEKVCETGNNEDLRSALLFLLKDPWPHAEWLDRPLQRLALAYLVLARRGQRPYDPVAYFHLSNGARLERINTFANQSRAGLEQSAGVMVNYRYSARRFEDNHEAFVHRNEIALSRPLAKELKSLRERWEEA